jgi:hypothetical protein
VGAGGGADEVAAVGSCPPALCGAGDLTEQEAEPNQTPEDNPRRSRRIAVKTGVSPRPGNCSRTRRTAVQSDPGSQRPRQLNSEAPEISLSRSNAILGPLRSCPSLNWQGCSFPLAWAFSPGFPFRQIEQAPLRGRRFQSETLPPTKLQGSLVDPRTVQISDGPQ